MSAPHWIRSGFVLAGLTNIVGITVFSKAFTSDALESLAPSLFSRPSLLVIVIWGLAYLALARSFDRAPAVSGVFAIEKAFYVVSWVAWHAGSHPPLAEIFETEPLAAIFFGIYGLVDLGFGVFFAYVYLRFRSGGR